MPLLVAMILLLSSLLSAAHDHGPGSWINLRGLKDPLTKHRCCDRRDCIPIAQDGIVEQSGGYLITETSERWPYSRVLWESQDGRWWRCVYMADQNPIHRRGQTRCLIGPPAGM